RVREAGAQLVLALVSRPAEIPQQISVTVAKPGDNVTLTCALSNTKLFYWFKLNFGYMIQTVTTGTYEKISLNGQFNNSRFNATKVGNVLSLTIRNVSKEDEATYFCQTGSSDNFSFINGTIVAVNGKKSITVKQTPDMESVHLSEPKTLQCSQTIKKKNVCALFSVLFVFMCSRCLKIFSKVCSFLLIIYRRVKK
uniref:Ig-like domain-containing protein n=1 Tax=Maylandia zebra TaxID=106582 RepID=A0A3P9CML1_9CICH